MQVSISAGRKGHPLPLPGPSPKNSAGVQPLSRYKRAWIAEPVLRSDGIKRKKWKMNEDVQEPKQFHWNWSKQHAKISDRTCRRQDAPESNWSRVFCQQGKVNPSSQSASAGLTCSFPKNGPVRDSQYYVLQKGVSGRDSCSGPSLDICHCVLIVTKQLDGLYWFELWRDFVECTFYHQQLCGAIGHVLKLYGRIDADLLLTWTGSLNTGLDQSRFNWNV